MLQQMLEEVSGPTISKVWAIYTYGRHGQPASRARLSQTNLLRVLSKYGAQ